MNGLLVIDKPQGVSSFDVVRKVRRWCGVRRVGHAGTLDPLATGVLLVAVGQATRLIEYLMADDKVYTTTMRLGETTDTQDSQGTLLETRPCAEITSEQIEAAATAFLGEIDQIPPMYSALKQNGTPLYKLARQGVAVERKSRRVRIDELTICDTRLPDVDLRVACSKGTYIRTLCHDLGEQLGCGAHITALRRVRSGCFDESMAHTVDTLQELADAEQTLPLLSPADALSGWPGYTLSGELLERLRNGIAPTLIELGEVPEPVPGTQVRLLCEGELVAIGRYQPAGVGKRRGDFENLKVFQQVIEDR